MEINELHPWPQDYEAAQELQKDLASRVSLQPVRLENISLVAGADVSSMRGDARLWAAVVVLRLPAMEVVEESFAVQEVGFPYIPGLLSFRELPVVIAALRKLTTAPDLLICDGQGLAHPRFLGLASHLGLWLQIPTIGCAKSRLVGEAGEPGPQPGDWRPLAYRGCTVGSVLRTRRKSKPVIVSPGHLVDVEQARRLVMVCCRQARLPEPTRLAHLRVNQFRKGTLSCDIEHI